MVGLIFVALGWVYGLRLPSLQAHCASTALDCVRLTTSHFRRGSSSSPSPWGSRSVDGMLLVFRQWTLEGTRRVLLGPHSHSPLGPCFGFSRSWSFRFSWNGSAQVSVPRKLRAAPPRAQGPGPWLPRVGSVWRRRADSLVRHQSLADGPAGWDEVPAGAKAALATRAKNLLLRLRVPL